MVEIQAEECSQNKNKNMKHVKRFESFLGKLANDVEREQPASDWRYYIDKDKDKDKDKNKNKNKDVQSYINMASKALNKDLTKKDAIPELRDNIEKYLQQGNDDMADKLTDIKMKLETLLKESFSDTDKLSSLIWHVWERHLGYVYEEDEKWMNKIKEVIETDDTNLYNDLTFLVDVNGGPIGEETYHLFIENLEKEL